MRGVVILKWIGDYSKKHIHMFVINVDIFIGK